LIIYTIGTSKKHLRDFISKLKNAGVKTLIDVRLNNTSQLAGYSKKEDLDFILSLVGIGYEHHPELAPTDKLLKDYKSKLITWSDYENEFNSILIKRDPLKNINLEFLRENKPICLLCSEDLPKNCHRRLVAEFYKEKIDEVSEIIHL